MDGDLIQRVADDLTAHPLLAFIAAVVTGFVALRLVLLMFGELGSWVCQLLGVDQGDVDVRTALLQLVESGAVDFNDITEGEADRWKLQRWARREDGSIEPEYVPLTPRIKRAAIDARESGLIAHRPCSTEIVLTEAGRDELHAQRYPRPTLGMQARGWLHKRGLVRHATPRRDPDTGELRCVPRGAARPATSGAADTTDTTGAAGGTR